MKINTFYQNFNIRDYMNEEEEVFSKSNEEIDCSLGTNKK